MKAIQQAAGSRQQAVTSGQKKTISHSPLLPFSHSPPPTAGRLPPAPRGMVLVIVLVAITMLSLAAYAFTELMLSENKAARLVTRQAQARALTESAAEMVRLYLAQPPQALLEAGGTYSNTAKFQAVQVVEDGTPRGLGRFTVISPLIQDGQVTGVRFGLENESARLNLNTLLFLEQQAGNSVAAAASSASASASSAPGTNTTANSQAPGQSSSQRNLGITSANNGQTSGQSSTSANSNTSSSANASSAATGSARSLLMALPAMTEEIADAILDWIDEDDEPREYGAEIDYYASAGYAPKNGPLDTIEELLLVRGVTPELLFGADANRNGIIDPSELNRAHLAESTGGDLEVDRGWAPYLTLYSKEANVRADGTPRIDLNNPDLQTLHGELEAALNLEWANFIIAYRQNGPYQQASTDDNGGEGSRSNSQSKTSDYQPANPFRLVLFQKSGSGNPSGGSTGGGGGKAGAGNTGGGGKSGGNNGGNSGGKSGGKGSGNSGGKFGGKTGGKTGGKGSGGKGSGGRGSGGRGGGGKGGGGRGGKGGAGAPGRGGTGGGKGGAGGAGGIGGTGSSTQKLEEVSAGDIEIDFTVPAKVSISQVLDLVGTGTRFQMPPADSSTMQQPKQVFVKGPFPDDPGAAATYLPLLMDNVTVNPATAFPGRININQASRVVLQGIPGMDQQTLEGILSNREPEPTSENPNRIHETWLYSEGLVDLATMRNMIPFITGGGNVYRAQIVGYFDQVGPARRVEAVIDASNATSSVPRIVFWRDISNLGRGFGLDTLGAGLAQ